MPGIFLGGVCYYFAYTCLAPLWEVPFANWELVHFLSIGVGVMLILVGSYRLLMVYKARKNQQQSSQNVDTLSKTSSEDETCNDYSDDNDDCSTNDDND